MYLDSSYFYIADLWSVDDTGNFMSNIGCYMHHVKIDFLYRRNIIIAALSSEKNSYY